MKILDRIGLALFSSLILILSIITCLVIFGWLNVELVHSIIVNILQDEVVSNIILALSVMFILLAIKCIFFDSTSKQEMDYKNGVVKGFESAENVTTRVELDKENNVTVFVNLSVKENAIIKELSTNLQTKIKTTIKNTSDLEVKEVNIKVKDIEPVKPAVQE